MKIRTLRKDDAQRLLAFELANRLWFEQSVLPRPEATYTPAGIVEHIASNLDSYAQGTMHPCVLVADDGEILGRANLKDIDRAAGSTEFGYRIAQQHAGRGLATVAVQELIARAIDQWQLNRLLAYVTTENPASARVLEKCGFVKTASIPDRSQLKHKLLDCHVYLYTCP